jgi:hypothetical protein
MFTVRDDRHTNTTRNVVVLFAFALDDDTAWTATVTDCDDTALVDAVFVRSKLDSTVEGEEAFDCISATVGGRVWHVVYSDYVPDASSDDDSAAAARRGTRRRRSRV